MKKAIHIAGFIIGVIVLYALAIAALAQKPPQKVYSKGSDWEDCKALAGPEGLQCRVLLNGRDIEVRSVAVDSDCKPPSCSPLSTDPVCSVGRKFVPCPPLKGQPVPFDVPAVATSVEIYQYSSRCYPISNTDVSCPPMPVKTIFTCTDKSRFLLFSEDGKAHCLKLAP